MNNQNHPCTTSPSAYIAGFFPPLGATRDDVEEFESALGRLCKNFGWTLDSMLPETIINNFGRVVECKDTSVAESVGPITNAGRKPGLRSESFRNSDKSVGQLPTHEGSNPSAFKSTSLAESLCHQVQQTAPGDKTSGV